MKFGLSLIGLSLVLSGCNPSAPKSAQEPTQACIENASQTKIARVDAENHRYFLVGAPSDIDTLAAKSGDIKTCFAESEWAGKWSLSLFSEAKYAGYAHEDAIQPFHKDDAWSKAYLAEFDGTANSLVINPATDAAERPLAP